MDNQAVEYSSEFNDLLRTIVFEPQEKCGLNWTVSYSHELAISTKLVDCVYLTWAFDWKKLAEKEVDGFTGCITVSLLDAQMTTPSHKYAVELTSDINLVSRQIGAVSDLYWRGGSVRYKLKYEMALQPYCLASRCLGIDTQFFARDDTDVTLEIENYHLNVNSHILKIHSDYFKRLLSSKFKEYSMEVISMPTVRYEVFARLLAMIHPNVILPSEEFYDGILELADYLSMPSIFRIIEQLLRRETHLTFNEVLLLADKHGMEGLVDECVQHITMEHRSKMTIVEELQGLSVITKKNIFG
ncbi:hypothetical protein GCK72_008191 [Caenorhabditis remanei]|uniref:BTB domain-containing protein n=1 Tax=Caenorhabditis remanei TaxID=31234 RepID=A0A6A5GZK1_CAERE|nr:hypothetical protein GCK72_008191 [Caenorhabditis remanei]KAF1759946.1 hypothetical protein GCK72_008191 [Caenorhabditis remanei]